MLFLFMNMCRWFWWMFLVVMVLGLIGLIRLVLFLLDRWWMLGLLVGWLIV